MLNYQNTDIQKLAEDLISSLTSITPGAGVGVGGVATKGYKTVINEDTLVLNNALSFSVSNTGTEDCYFTHDPLDAPGNRQVISVADVLNFGGAINFFAYTKFFATAPLTTLTITYILRA